MIRLRVDKLLKLRQIVRLHNIVDVRIRPMAVSAIFRKHYDVAVLLIDRGDFSIGFDFEVRLLDLHACAVSVRTVSQSFFSFWTY